MRTFLSLFTGIGGMDLGLEQAGWRCVGQCELDPYRRGVLERWWPGVPRWSDVRTVSLGGMATHTGELRGHDRATGDGSAAPPTGGLRDLATLPDLICGGFPCQDLSVAGKRAGLDGSRSGLFFEFARIVGAVRPRWVLIENVPGLLSSHRGRDFAVVLATLADLGYGVAWRVLDSRYFGVPQRRRRVFVVGYLGARGPEPFLPFLEGGGGHPAAGGEARSDVAVASLSGIGSGGPDDNDGQNNRIIVNQPLTRGRRLNGGDEAMIAHTLTSEGHDAGEDGTGRGTPLVAAPLSHGSNPNSNAAGRRREDDENVVAWTFSQQSQGMSWESDQYPTFTKFNGGNQQHGIRQGAAVRRLTPVECCRLQGFPDDWLGGNTPPDSPKYAALGDAVTVPVAEWIGRRIA